MAAKYPEEVSRYIIDHCEGTYVSDLVKDLNQRFGKKYNMTFARRKISSYKKNHGLKSGVPRQKPAGYSIKYPPGMLEYLEEIAEGKTNQELTDAVNERFGSGTITLKQLAAFKKNHKITSGLTGHFEPGHVPVNKGKKLTPEQRARLEPTMFKKGNVPHNTRQIGDYTRQSDGYLVRKVKDTGPQRERWIPVHREVWESHHGPIPEGGMIIFLDGNKENLDISNLALVDNETNLEMNRKELRFDNGDLTKTGLEMARLNIAVRKRKEKLKNANRSDRR